MSVHFLPIKAGIAWRALQERVIVQPTTSFHNAVVIAVVREQEEADATVAVTEKYEPVYIKEEAL